MVGLLSAHMWAVVADTYDACQGTDIANEVRGSEGWYEFLKIDVSNLIADTRILPMARATMTAAKPQVVNCCFLKLETWPSCWQRIDFQIRAF